MTTNLLPLRPVVIRASAAPGPHKTETNRRKTSSASSNWWTPLFGWSSEPDYISSENKPEDDIRQKKESGSESDQLSGKQRKSRFAPGCFTEEKARQLRLLTTDTFHDAMYHSAIASRLASDFKRRSDQ